MPTGEVDGCGSRPPAWQRTPVQKVIAPPGTLLRQRRRWPVHDSGTTADGQRRAFPPAGAACARVACSGGASVADAPKGGACTDACRPRACGGRPTQTVPAATCACAAAARSSSALAARSAHSASPRSATARLMRRTRAGATHLVPQERAAVVVRDAARAALTSGGDGTRAFSAARRRQQRANRPETFQFRAWGSASAARAATAASDAPTARQRSHVTQWNAHAPATVLQRTGAQRPAACRLAPRTPHEPPLPAWRGLQRADGASPAPPAQLACVTRRAPGSTSRAMRTAAGRHVVTLAVGARQLATCAPQRAGAAALHGKQSAGEDAPQRATGAANARSARVCAPIGDARERRSGSALCARRRRSRPVSPASCSGARARHAGLLRARQRPCAVQAGRFAEAERKRSGSARA